MPKDVRNLLEDFKDEKIELSNDHQTKFTARLIEELHPKKTSFQWLYVVASIVLLLGLSITFYPTENTETPFKNSPDYIHFRKCFSRAKNN